MEIGEIERQYTIEPIENPIRKEQPSEAPSEAPVAPEPQREREKVPA